jgi:hypothetical protein
MLQGNSNGRLRLHQSKVFALDELRSPTYETDADLYLKLYFSKDCTSILASGLLEE